MKNILVLCTGNSCRSQMAHGYLEHFTNPYEVSIYSAGIETHGVNPKAIETMKEDDIDISSYSSNNVNDYVNIPFDFVITVCDNAKEHCPYFPSLAIKLHYNFPDPAKAIGNAEVVTQIFSEVRELIKTYCIDFVKHNLPKEATQNI